MEVGRRGLLSVVVFYSFSLLEEWRSIIQGGRLFGSLEYADMCFFQDFAAYTGSDFFNRKNDIRFGFRRSKLVENDTSLAYIGQFWFWRQFWAKNAKNRTRGS